jgi:mannose-1-phosphate guanylyltransferase/mannose-1-phosphate guanylyltransferase/mannose-6-phosphate isomerase
MLPVVISGGRGTRLWPYSRAKLPKPFCGFFEESLMEKTLRRLQPLGVPGVVSVEEQKTLTQGAFRRLGITPSLSLYEPFGRGTAASVALVCRVLLEQKRGDEVVGIFPADHLVQDDGNFFEAVKAAVARAEKGLLVTLGIPPSHAATGYGYIEVAAKPKTLEAISAVRFHEKPSPKLAQDYLESGRYFWNAGIFIFQPAKMSALFEKHAPDLWKRIQSADLSRLAETYRTLPSISIDYAVMEKLQGDFECVPCEAGWSDVGTWSEIKKFAKTQAVFERHARDTAVFSMNPEKTFAVAGVDGLIVVDTPDALLITKDGEAQEVGPMVSEIEKTRKAVTEEHRFDLRPWGDYRVLEDAAHFKIKSIRVNPGERLSYQSHARRAEHWIVVSGEAVVTLDDKDRSLKTGDYIFIPVGGKHRIRNTGQVVVEFVEVQTGSYFGEDDIVRYTDDYGRA